MESKIISKKKSIVIAIAGLILCLFVGVNIYLLNKKETKTTFNVKAYTIIKKNLTDTIVVQGQVSPTSEENIYFDPSKGEIEKIYIKVGQTVKKGENLYKVSNKDLDTQEKQGIISRDKALVQINYYKDRMTNLKIKMNKEKTRSPLVNMDSLDEQLKEFEYQQKLATLDYQVSKETIESIKKKQEDLYIKSSMDGTVTHIEKDPRSNPNMPFINIIDHSSNIEGFLTEFEVVHVKQGQHVELRAKAIANRKWTGKISSVYDTPVHSDVMSSNNQQSSISKYPFTITLTEKDSTLKNGLHMEAEIDIKSINNAIVIPNTSVLEGKNQKDLVIISENNHFKVKKIKTGYRNSEYTEVIKGLQLGQRVIITPSEKLIQKVGAYND
ncbi:efflux RND transporter periplasmic adaptor subunit [Neobacillus sp. PS3-40]|uniref:efflux RND transporter periplasmic adaptor subunit n=1 Tax=Neobacillus sp. PS3-40 TaxID=3070679 RepID=UPI0027E091A5|nr:efflux RND transporter periplasmic adaptor subunit [Neobacillus sp. PS3-40]WML46162.1 efflux RND transporter periplasmic adaptor subunit [Neobacillus sp. PS3-40]